MSQPHTGRADVTGVNPTQVITYRHSTAVRITHWINVLCLLILVMSGLQIFNATPAVYWGQQSNFAAPLYELQIPAWATLPGYQDLATGRRWHFFFAWAFVFNGLAYLVHSFATRHVQRDLIPTAAELKNIPTVIRDHARLKFPHGEEAKRYNALQQLSYVGVVFVLSPLTVLAGLTMSPGIDAAAPWLLDLFGGRQSARTVHFICAFTIVGFVLVHVIMVLVSGVWNNLRSMITGRYAIQQEELHP